MVVTTLSLLPFISVYHFHYSIDISFGTIILIAQLCIPLNKFFKNKNYWEVLKDAKKISDLKTST